MESKIVRFTPICRSIANKVANGYPDVEADDLFQDLLIYVMTTETYQDENSEFAVPGITREARKYAREYRRQHLILSPQYSYRTADVRSALETLWEEDGLKVQLANDMRTTSSQYIGETKDGEPIFATINDDVIDRAILRADICRAVKSLAMDERLLIFDKYYYGKEVSAKRLRRVIEKMTDYLNYSPGQARASV